MSVKSAFTFALNAARVLFVVFLLYVLALATFSYVFDAGIDGVFNDAATCVAFGLFYLGYAVGAAASARKPLLFPTKSIVTASKQSLFRLPWKLTNRASPFYPFIYNQDARLIYQNAILKGEGFEELVRAIYGKSSYLRPPLGARPAWLNKGDGSITDVTKAFISPNVTNRSNTPFETFLYELSSASKRAFAFTAASSEKQIKLLQYDAIDRYPPIVNHYYEVVNLIPRPHSLKTHTLNSRFLNCYHQNTTSFWTIYKRL